MMAIINYTAATDLLSFTADAGEADNVAVTSPGANAVRIVVAGGDTISLAGNTAAPLGAFILSVGNTQLDIDTTLAPIARFDINLGDMGDMLAFGLANPVIGDVDIDGEAATDTVTLNALTITGLLSVTSETINLGGIVTASGDVSLTAVNSLTDGADNDVADIAGAVVTLNVTGAGNAIGVNTTNFLEVDAATRLDASTSNGNMALKNVAGNLSLGALNAGNAFIFLTTRNGAMTDGNGAAVNLTAANGASLTTTGTSSAIGTLGDAIETAIGALTATTYDGGIFVADSNGPGLTINNVLAKEGGQTPFIDGSNQIVVFDPLPANTNPHSGVHDVSISATGPILLNSVTAPDAVTITAATGSIIDFNQASNNILAQSVNLVAQGAAAGSAVGQASDPLESTVETFSASTTNGSIFLTQGIVSTAVSVVAGGANNDVVLTSSAASLSVQTVTALGNVTVNSGGGSLLDANGAAMNITGQFVDLTGKSGIGTAADPLETTATQLSATVSDPAAKIFINEVDGLTSIAVKTNAGDMTINFTGGPLTFDPSTQLLSLSGTAALTFETTAGNVKLGVVDAGNSAVSVTAFGTITDDNNDAVVDLRGGTVTLTAGTGIGASGNTIDTDVATLNATTNSGGVFIRETNALIVSASTTVGDIDVRNTTGNMTLGLVSAPGALAQVTLHAGGAILDGNAIANNVSADTLNLVAMSGIGFGDALETSVNFLTANGGAGGGLLLANNKALTLTSVGATGGTVSISATGSLTLDGPVSATGQPVTLTATLELIDSNVGNDITAASITLNGSKIGFGDKIETTTAAITAATTTGGIFLSNTGATLALTATALGQAADIDIDTTGNIVLSAVTAQGDTVKLRAAGSITDGNDPPPPIAVNITAKKLDIAAPGGIGTAGNPLEMDVDVVITADGGASGAFITFTGPLLLTATALEASGSGALTFDAESITIENISDNTATIAAGRSLVLRTPAGAIVFLDAADTIQTSGAGTITVQAGTALGIGTIGVAVLGNLKTSGGNILVEADRTITIGQLDAGVGDVTVRSLAGIIIDGNGVALNVIAGTTTLSGAGPTARAAELDETFRIAEAAAANAEAESKQTSADAFLAGEVIIVAAEAAAQATVVTTVQASAAADAAVDAQAAVVLGLEIGVHIAEGVAFGIEVGVLIAEAIMGPAQAIPLTGDFGAGTAWAIADIALHVAEGVALGLSVALTVEEHKLDDLEDVAVAAQSEQFAAESTLTLATATAEAFGESSSITVAAAEKAAIIRDASERIRDQAILARDQVNVIGTFATPLGLQVTGVINVTAGPTDSYLQVVGATALDLIQTTGSITLISTGTITDADAGAGSDILGTGLRIVAVGGIGTAADPLETRVATLNATNTTAGAIAIANTAGTPAALDITGISNAGGGDVIISNTGSTAAGQGITVSGPITATGGTAGITVASGSPLVVSANMTAAGAILLTAAETAGAGDDLTVNSGVTLESTGSSVTLQAGDNILVSAGSTIKAFTSIIITADNNNADAAGVNVVIAGALVAPLATIGVDPAADDNDTFTITPSVGAPITVDADGGSDTLNFIADGLAVTILGNVITAAGRLPVTFNNFEFVNILNASGGGNITLNTAPGNVDSLILTGTGQKAGTFTLSGGVPFSFSGVDSFTFNAGNMDDTATVSPFATSVLPWNVAVKIDGGDGADRITYNNVAGLRDTTEVTATAPQSGHIDSPGVTSALHSQLVTFTNVEDLTVNANPGEDEKLIVNLRDTFAADTANLLFDPAPGADDLQLVGLFDMVIDTTNYVGLTLNGRGGDDTFNVTPGPIPVFVDGGDPIGSTAGDTINFNPAGAYVLAPGPQNDEGGLNPVGAQRVSWDHVEGISVTGGSQGVFLGTNGDDDITIIARDSSTHVGADGVRDFTVSLNNGPSVLFINAPAFFVDALAGDDDVELRAPAPNNAVWDVVGMTLRGNDGSDGINAATGVGSTSPITLEGGAGDDFLEGGAGNDRFFGNEGNDTFVGGPGNDTFDGGPGFDTVLIRGTSANDVLDVFQNAPSAVNDSGYAFNLSFNGVAQTDILTQDTSGSPQTAGTRPTVEEVRIEAGLGNDLIRVGVSDAYSDLDASNGAPNQSLRFNVLGDAPNASDRLVVRDDGFGDLIALRQAPDQRSGRVSVAPGVTISGGGTGLADVVYEGIERLDITPLNSISGGTGTDGNGRIDVFHSDPFEYNDTRLTPTTLSRVGESPTRPTIDPGAVVAPFAVPGDEDWYEFRPQATGTFAVKILFDKQETLFNGRAGLPGEGNLNLDIYDANGGLITSGTVDLGGKTATFGATPTVPQFARIFVRVRGATPDSINHYEFDNLNGVGSGNPGVINVDVFGPQVTDVLANNIPTTTYNLFGQKPANAPFKPTPLVNSLTIQLRDIPTRAPGFLYNAIEPTTATTSGTYVVKGDATGIAVISQIILINNPPVLGGIPTASIQIVFARPLPDDRFTLTINDNLKDPAGNKLDGESNAAEPNGAPTFPSGDTTAGGDFIARFTIDSRAELGAWASGSVYVDTNGNNLFDPTNADATNRDITYLMGFTSDNIFAGNFSSTPFADGFDKLAAYGKVGTNYRWLIDTNNDGLPEFNVIQPLFAGVTSVNGTPVAGNFDGNAANGDEVALKVGNTWLLDTNHDFKVDTKLVGSNMVGLPITGDFDGDGKDDLGAWGDDRFKFDFASNGLTGNSDFTVGFGFSSVRERPVASDFDGDGITDFGLWVPDRSGVAPTEAAEWYLFISAGQNIWTRNAVNGGIFFKPTPFGADRYAQFGDEFGLPVPGNFDPPITPTQPSGGFTNSREREDVNNDGSVSPIDALLIINKLNSGDTELVSTPFSHAPFMDVNGDGSCAPIDALIIINKLNAASDNPAGEGEGESADSFFAKLGSGPSSDDSLWVLLAIDDYHVNRKK